MRIGARLVVEQRDAQIDLAVRVVVVLDRVDKTVVVRVGVLHYFLDARRDRLRRRRLTTAMKLGILVDSPRAPLGAREMQLAIKDADVQLAAAGVVFVKLAAIAERISLRVTRDAGLLVRPSHRQLRVIATPPLLRRIEIDVFWTTKAVHRVVHLHAFPAMIVVVFVKHEIHRRPLRVEKLVVALLELMYMPHEKSSYYFSNTKYIVAHFALKNSS